MGLRVSTDLQVADAKALDLERRRDEAVHLAVDADAADNGGDNDAEP